MKISGHRLMEARELAGVTRSDLAVAAELTHARIWQIETSDTANVNSHIAAAMAKTLKVSVDQIAAE